MANQLVRLQDDLIAIHNQASSGDVLILEEGTYMLPSQLRLKKGVSIKGQGSDKTILTTNNPNFLTNSGGNTEWGKYLVASYNSDMGRRIDEADNVLEGFSIQSTTTRPLHGGVGFWNKRGIRVQDVEVKNTYWSGLNFLFVEDAGVYNSSFEDCGAYVGTGQFSYSYGVVNICTSKDVEFYGNSVVDNRPSPENAYIFTSLGTTENEWRNVKFKGNYFYSETLSSQWSQNGNPAPTYFETYTTAHYGTEFINNYIGVTMSLIYESAYDLEDFDYAIKFENNYHFCNSFAIELTVPNKVIMDEMIWEARNENDFGAILANFNGSLRNDIDVSNVWLNTAGKRWSGNPIPQGYYYTNAGESLSFTNVNVSLSVEELKDISMERNIGIIDANIPAPDPEPDPEPDPQPEPNMAIIFELYNAQTNEKITDLSGTVLNKVYLGDTGDSLSVAAVPQAPTSAVFFFVNGNFQRREGVAPYAISGDARGNFAEWKAVEAGRSFTIRAQTAEGIEETIQVEFLSGNEPVDVTPDTQAPSVPTGLVSSDITRNSFRVSWNQSNDDTAVTGYKVFKDGELSNVVDDPTTVINSLDCDSRTTIQVTAFDAAGNESVRSSEITVITSACPDTQSPTRPVGLTTSLIEQTSFFLEWGASTDNVAISGYQVFVDNRVIDTVEPFLSITGLKCGNSYPVTAIAIDSSGNISAPSDEILVRTTACPPEPDTTPPSAPTGLSASNITRTSFALNWAVSSDNEGVAGYRVWRDGQLVGEVTGTSLPISNLACDDSYRMEVSAFDSAGNESARSSVLNVATLSCPEPDPVFPIVIDLAPDSKVKLDIDDSAILGTLDIQSAGVFEVFDETGKLLYKFNISG